MRVRRSPASLRLLVLLLCSMLAAAVLTQVAPAAHAAELPGTIQDGGYIISDAEFFNAASMNEAQIQKFLDGKVSSCSAGATCLKTFRGEMASQPRDAYCAAVSGQADATVARMVSRAAKACGINPKVILVMMQKEQGLVTATKPTSWNYEHAMGQDCPDETGCSTAAAGFWNQVYLGARQLQMYTKNPTVYDYQAGRYNVVQWAPSATCGSSAVYIKNQATANLYNYTPYRANVAALAAGWGSGDSCSAYGNRNFYNFYVTWFAPSAVPAGSVPAEVPACTVPVMADISTRYNTATVNVTSVNLRIAPSPLCKTGIQTLTKGMKVTVVGAYGAWSRVKAAGQTAWVLSTYLKMEAAAATVGCAQPGSVQPAAGVAVVAAATVNVRQAPSTNCSTGVTSLKRGQKFTRTGTAGAWWRIVVQGKTMWAHSDYLTVTGGDPSFKDVPTTAPFYDEVTWLAASKVTTGYTDGTFRPRNSVTREAMAAFLYRLEGSPAFTPPRKSPFKDVPTTAKFYKQVAWLAASKITTGYPDGTFRPRNQITREAMSALLYRMEGKPSFRAPAKSPFKDLPTSATFYREVTWLASTGVTTGYSDRTFRPRNSVTREATAAFLYRLEE
ncbi:hypothetical protein ET475_11920 [Microbacterium protaetiae]|uniref:SH3 domain-containing protein n=1 Tax=Microbacterium protaetiae TaxID=2509458 RepID=A0A4P6EGN8_9MICO|nr:S-layer homology domain-containing protein [Microbacterium protaetiae]QAY60623.1 hypothetical protein ET475_11920 [Microbacterium protaetiae]